MSDDLPFSRYSEPYLDPFPPPQPEEPRPREEREAEKKEDFTPPFCAAYGKAGSSKRVPPPEALPSALPSEDQPFTPPQFEEKFEEEFNEDVLKLGIKVVVFTVFVVAIGFLFWFFMNGGKPATEPSAPVVSEEK